VCPGKKLPGPVKPCFKSPLITACGWRSNQQTSAGVSTALLPFVANLWAKTLSAASSSFLQIGYVMLLKFSCLMVMVFGYARNGFLKVG
jgi:hypothetical protein